MRNLGELVILGVPQGSALSPLSPYVFTIEHNENLDSNVEMYLQNLQMRSIPTISGLILIKVTCCNTI